jgi:hypothetical protein
LKSKIPAIMVAVTICRRWSFPSFGNHTQGLITVR